MATYLPNITDQPAPILPFQPDWNFLNQMLTMATQKWKIASEQASILYNSYLDAYHINDDVRAMRDEYRKNIDNKLTELASHNLTDIRVMKSFKDLVTGLSSNPYYLYDLQTSAQYREFLSNKEIWANTVPNETSGYRRWHSSIEKGLSDMVDYYKGVKMTEENLPVFGFINANMRNMNPVDIDEEAYVNALGAQQFDKLKVSTQGGYMIGNTVSFAGPSFGGIKPYIVKETGGNAIRGFVHDAILKDFNDGNLKRLQDKKAMADMFTVGKSYNYDWSKVVEHYSTHLQSRIDMLNNTAEQIDKQVKSTDEQAASFLLSVSIAGNQARSAMERIADAEKAQAAEIYKQSSDAGQLAVKNIIDIANNASKEKEMISKGKKDINSALMAARLFHQIDGLNNILIMGNKWVDAHTVKDIEYNKAFGDILDYLLGMEKIKAEAQNQQNQKKIEFLENEIKSIPLQYTNNEVTASANAIVIDVAPNDTRTKSALVGFLRDNAKFNNLQQDQRLYRDYDVKYIQGAINTNLISKGKSGGFQKIYFVENGNAIDVFVESPISTDEHAKTSKEVGYVGSMSVNEANKFLTKVAGVYSTFDSTSTEDLMNYVRRVNYLTNQQWNFNRRQ